MGANILDSEIILLLRWKVSLTIRSAHHNSRTERLLRDNYNLILDGTVEKMVFSVRSLIRTDKHL